MVLVIENQNLEYILERKNLPDVFVVAQRRANNLVDAAAVCLFDEKGILHVVDAVDPDVPHLYYISVPVKRRGFYVGNLDQTLVFDNDRSLIGESKLGNGLRAFTKVDRVPNAGYKLLARREYVSQEITSALKKVSEDYPLVYLLEKPERFADEYFFRAKEGSINIKSVVKGRVFETKSLLNIFPLIVNSTEELRQDKQQQLAKNFQVLIFASVITSVSITLLRLSYQYEENDIDKALALTVGGALLSQLYFIFDNVVGSRTRSFRRCLKFLEERTRKNKELCDLGFELALLEREGKIETTIGVTRELQMKTILPKLKRNRFRREGNKNTQVSVFEFSDFEGENIEDVRNQVERFALAPAPQVQAAAFKII